ncbi:MAG: glycosyltransferase [Candidatus Eisenbacteria bacterium]|nr:glycosyltransferase [Candidatus Eisenbacteria bacterium]
MSSDDAARPRPDISLFYPMYNEEANVDEAVETALSVLARLARRYEVILVNDGSRDRTGELADAWTKRRPEVRAVHHDRNRGYGAGLQSGIRAARYDWVFYTDGDNQFVLDDLERMLPLRDERTIVTGYREARNDPWHRKLNASIYNLAIRVLFGLRLRDVDCAFKLYPPGLFADMPLVSNGAVIDVEILARARRAGYRFREMPVHHRPRRHGEQSGANLKVILRAFRELGRLWLELR